MLINEFDPWKSEFCTCPPKYSFSPYTGCSHACVYCYITSYIPNPFKARLKKDVTKRLKKELKSRFIGNRYISMSNSSDPYTPEEKIYGATRKSLKIFRENEIKVLIVTKSDLVARDIDLISKMKASVSMTVTTLKNEIARVIEPNAPSPERRIEALETMWKNGIPCSVRLDPIIPGINDGEIEKIVGEASKYCHHIVSSTIKPRKDSLKRLKSAMPEAMDKIEFVKKGNSYYLPSNTRYELMKRVRDACELHNLSFATCREGFDLNTATCDGSQLIEFAQNKKKSL
ncbi:MAG: radical SAM protein [Candidatus Thermoplasmatota archaeon]|nr:radical SAM protein [Candidatus Thermoplasmatota archaeon]